MKLVRLPLFALALVLGLSLAACAGTPPAAEEPAEPDSPVAGVPLRMWGQHDLTDTENEPSRLMQQRIDAFESSTGIEVVYEQVAWDQLAPKLALAVTSGGDVPDLVEASSQHVTSLLDAGALLPLDDFFDDAAWVADMNANDTRSCVYDDVRYCVSNLVRSSVTYYRVADFPEGFPATSEGWLEAGTQLADDTFLTSFFANKEYAAVELNWGQWIYSNGGRLFDDEGRPAWVSPETVEVVEFGRTLFAENYVPEVVLTGDFVAVEAPWINGSAASLRGGTWSLLFVPDLREQVAAGEVAVTGGVSFGGSPPTVFMVSENWVIPTGAENPAAAALWINQFMEAEFLQTWSQAQVGIPTMQAAFAAGDFSSPFYETVNDIMIEQGRFIEQSPFYVESLTTLAVALQELMLDPELDIEAQLREAEEEVLNRYW